MPPSDLEYIDFPILISSKTMQQSILDQIKAMGLKNKVMTLY